MSKGDGFLFMQNVMKKGMRLIEELYDKEYWPDFKVLTGFKSFDRLTAGFFSGDLIVITGSGTGKTAFALNVAINVAKMSEHFNTPFTVGMFTMQTPLERISLKMMCIECGVLYRSIIQGMISRCHWPKLTSAAGYLSELPIIIKDIPTLTIKELIDQIGELKDRNESLKPVIIDSLNLLGTDNPETLKVLKIAARALHLPIVLTYSANHRKRKRRETNLIEPDYEPISKYADLIINFYSDGKNGSIQWNDHCDCGEEHDEEEFLLHKIKTEITVLKNNNGSTGNVFLDYLPQQCRFMDRDR